MSDNKDDGPKRTIMGIAPLAPAESNKAEPLKTDGLKVAKTMMGSVSELVKPAPSDSQQAEKQSQVEPNPRTAKTMMGSVSELVKPADSKGATDSGEPPPAAASSELDTVAGKHKSAPSEDEADSLAQRRVGQELGGYKVIRKLAEGGMGVVYEAEHTKIGRRGAIKVLKAEFCQDPKVVERFYQEARAVNEIGHENIVDIFDFGKTPEGGVFFVMDFLEGMDLGDRLKKEPMHWDESLKILRQTILALKAAHAKGFVHRDLKPDNIFLETKDGNTRVKLLDFGIAKLVGLDGAEDKLTRTGSMIGTPHYMSPEQINGSADVDRRTDIYSLGIIIYEIFSGSTPFHGNTLGEIITGHLLEEPPRLKDIPEDLGVPQPIADIIHRMLAKKPSERYDSVDDVLSDLVDIDKDRAPEQATALEQSRPMTMSAALPARTLTEAAPPASSKKWIPIVGLGAVALAAGAFMMMKGNDKKAETKATPITQPIAQDAPSDEPAPEAIDYDKVRTQAQELIRASLAEPAPGTRLRGSDAAGDTRDTGSAAKLFELAQTDPSAEVRCHAASALGKIGHADAPSTFASLEKNADEPLKPWYADALQSLGDDSARKRLLKYSKSKNLAVAFKAVLSLADASQPGDKDTIAALTKLTTREAELNEVVPFAGALLLTKLAALRSSGARGILYKILEQDNEEARLAAAEGLARLGDDGGAEVLSSVLSNTNSAGRLRAAVTLVLLGDYSGYDVLAEELQSDDPDQRIQAAQGMGYLGEKRSVLALLPLLEDKNWSVRVASAVALVAIVGLDPALLAKASVDWANSALQSEDWNARKAAADVLGDMPEKEAAPLLAQAIADASPKVREAAARSAAKMRSPEVAKSVASAALVEKDKVAQEAQVRALGSIGSPAVTDALRELTNDTGRVGVFAAGSLIAVGDVSGKERLVEAVGDKRTTIRMAAVEAASEAKNPTVVPVLATGTGDKVFDVRFKASEGLATYGAEKALAVPVLETGLESKSVSIQARAQVSLAKFGINDALVLSADDLLNSANPEDRLAAIAVVKAQPWKEAKPRLRRLVADSDLNVRRASVDALSRFVEKEKEGVTTLYKGLTKDSDAVTRAKAQAQLSKIVKPLKEASTKTGVAPAPTTPSALPADAAPTIDPASLAELDAKLESLKQSAASLETPAAAAKGHSEAILALAKSEATTKTETKIRRTLRELKQTVADISTANEAANTALLAIETIASSANTEAAQAKLTAAKAHAASIAKSLADAKSAEVAAQAASDAFKLEEEATEVVPVPEPEVSAPTDPAIPMAEAEKAFAAGKMAAARKSLREAKKLFNSSNTKPTGDYYFLDGMLNRALVDSASDKGKRTRYLRKSQESFFKVLKLGTPERITTAKAQLAEIGPMLTDLLMVPEGADSETLEPSL